MIYAPAGVAHGFITLEDATELHYQMAEPFVQSATIGIRWDDPQIGIQWPSLPRVISSRDRDLPYLNGRGAT